MLDAAVGLLPRDAARIQHTVRRVETRMADAPKIEQADVDQLLLDPENPRLRRASDDPLLEQDALLREMVAWELDELVVSYLESGFWKHEPLIAIKEDRDGLHGLVVVEGNRRVAALKCLRAVIRGQAVPSRRIRKIIEDNLPLRPDLTENDPIFTEVPFVSYETRQEVDAYLGFRHVTGVKQWEPQEKATFIAHLIDLRRHTYDETAKLIGSKPENVRRNYIAFHLLNTFEKLIESEDAEEALRRARDDFSVFFLSLREAGVRRFLNISLAMEPAEVRKGIGELDRPSVERFLIWMFGTESIDSFIGESRNVKKFAEILSTPEAVEYITEKKAPNFDIAYGLTRGASEDIVAALKEARELLRNVLGDLDLKREEKEVIEAAWPVVSAAAEIAFRLGGETLSRLEQAIADARRS